MPHYYCSIASRDYMYKVLALYNSMVRNDNNFKFFIICMDEVVLSSLSGLMLENTELISADDIEEYYPELKEIRKSRSEKEYAWTIKPSVFLYLFGRYAFIDHILWLDGDTMFFSSPEPIYSEWGDNSILLTEEKYTGKYAYMSLMYGVYNTGLLGFKRDDSSFECLKWFRERLNEWCYDRMENGLWSDQMYVNDWTQRFKGVKVVEETGINMTPFILKRLVSEEKSKVFSGNEGVYVGDKRLILFHYYGFRYKNRNEYDICTYKDWKFSNMIIQHIYMPYIYACESSLQQLKQDTKTIEAYHPHCCYCTLVTLEYLAKCLALLESIRKHNESFHIWVCCIDADAFDILTALKLENVTVLCLSAIEDASLRAVKGRRKKHEYCWTLKAPLILHIFENYLEVDSLLYVDSDTFLFSEPDKCFNTLKEHPVLLTCHNFSPSFKQLYKEKGSYNAGIIGFKRCSTAFSCLKWWKRKCIEWCYDAVSGGRFADQKYLERFVKSNSSVYVEDNIGMNAAVWNIRDAEVHTSNGKIYIDDELLVFYHFSSFIIIGENKFDLWKWSNLGVSASAKELIYMPYAKAVAKAISTVKPYIEDISVLFESKGMGYKASNLVHIESKL